MVNDITKRRRNRIFLLLILLVVGGLSCRFYVLAPIHEFSHIIAANLLGGRGGIGGWTEALVSAKYGSYKVITWAGAYGEMIVYLLLYGLLHVWKLRAGGLFWFGAANTCLFRTHRITDFDTHTNFWTGEAGDTETAAALLTFHAVFGVLLAIGWILLVGREWVYQTEFLPYLRPEPPRSFLERVRRRWG